MTKIFIFIFFIINLANTAKSEDLCEFFMYCPGSSQRSGGKSLPSAIVSGQLNPSTLSKIKGLGLEAFYHPHNPVGFGLLTGSGKIGALVSANQENSFFGNRSIELDIDTFRRYEDSKRFDNKKLSFAAGAGLYNKNKIAFDVGVTAKWNPDIKKVRPGIGFSGNVYNFNLGYSIYYDDTLVKFGDALNPYTGHPYFIDYNAPTYKEVFVTQAYTIGTKLGDLFLDYGVIKTQYDFYRESTIIHLYSFSYNKNKWLYNLAIRREASPNWKYIKPVMVEQRKVTDLYLGLQYSHNKNLLLGLAYNRFLLNELSASVTLSF